MADHKHGEMNIAAQQKTFDGFMRFGIWGGAISLVFFIILAIAIA